MPATSYSFVDKIVTGTGWLIVIVPGGFKYVCTEEGAEAVIDRLPPHEDVTVIGSIGDSITHVGSTAIVETSA